MKTTAIILYILLGIWAIFSFDEVRVKSAIKYLGANLVAQPYKTTIYLILVVLLSTALSLIVYYGFISPFKNQRSAIDPVYVGLIERNYNTADFKTSEYVVLYEKLKQSNDKNLNLRKKVLKFIDKSRFVYQNLPQIVKNNINYNTKIFNFNRVTQVTLIYIKKYRHTFLFISHNENKPDKELKEHIFDVLPNNIEIKKIVDPIFPQECFELINSAFDRWLENKEHTVHGSAGLYVHTDRSLDGRWLCIGIQEPNQNYNLNNLIAEVIGFQNQI